MHDVQHGFQEGRGNRTVIIEANLDKKLAVIHHPPPVLYLYISVKVIQSLGEGKVCEYLVQK